MRVWVLLLTGNSKIAAINPHCTFRLLLNVKGTVHVYIYFNAAGTIIAKARAKQKENYSFHKSVQVYECCASVCSYDTALIFRS